MRIRWIGVAVLVAMAGSWGGAVRAQESTGRLSYGVGNSPCDSLDWKAGAWCWLDDDHAAMLAVVPTSEAPGYFPIRLFMDRSADDWSIPGSVVAWDGDVDAPR